MVRNWRGGAGTDGTAIQRRVDGRPDRYTFVCSEERECCHPYCERTIQVGENVYRSRNRDAEYCSKLCRERHVRILVQQRRRIGAETRAADRASLIRRKYGITVEQWESMYSLQMGRCAVCRNPLVEGKGTNVDHDHSCCPGVKSCGACVRALLCSNCNGGLGFFFDDIALLEQAIVYLREHQERGSRLRQRVAGRR